MPSSDEFASILTDHLDDMYALAIRFTGSKDNAEDLVHDLFVNLSLKRYQSREIRNPRAWLASILYRIFVDQWRRRVNAPVQYGYNVGHENETGHHENVICIQPGPARALEIDDQQQRLQQALDSLNERQQQIVVLHEIEGYTQPEVAQILAIPLGTVKSGLFRAKEKLLQQLSLAHSGQASNPAEEKHIIDRKDNQKEISTHKDGQNGTGPLL
ncbi:MAG: RNA polymerase sigma factor [Thiohalomonadales bacterium]